MSTVTVLRKTINRCSKTSNTYLETSTYYKLKDAELHVVLQIKAHTKV